MAFLHHLKLFWSLTRVFITLFFVTALQRNKNLWCFVSIAKSTLIATSLISLR